MSFRRWNRIRNLRSLIVTMVLGGHQGVADGLTAKNNGLFGDRQGCEKIKIAELGSRIKNSIPSDAARSGHLESRGFGQQILILLR